MGFASLMGNVQRLMASAEALAAIGAELRLRQSGSECDPQVRKLLQRIIEFIDPALLDGVEPQQQAIVLNGISSYFRQAADLLENPARPPGWMVHDPAVLQAQGRASARIVHHINGLGATRTALLETLNEPGAFLDVGTVGWLAIEAARLWPKMRVVGIDPWELVLELARKNVADSGVGDRIELRKLGAEALNESDAYTLVWFASPFIPPAISRQAAQRSVRALRPGGWMIFGLYASLPDALGESLAALRVVRSGGYPWMPAETESFLRDCGLELIETGPNSCSSPRRTFTPAAGDRSLASRPRLGYARPGGNLTGATALSVELGPKQLEFLHELVPSATNLALLLNPLNPSVAANLSTPVKRAARAINLELHEIYASNDDQLHAAVAKASQSGIGGIVVGADPFFNSRSGQLAALAVQYQIPTASFTREFALAGGLVSYVGSFMDLFRFAGIYAGRILRGEKPANLPVVQATKVELVLNLKAARALGLEVPATLLARADEVIE